MTEQTKTYRDYTAADIAALWPKLGLRPMVWGLGCQSENEGFACAAGVLLRALGVATEEMPNVAYKTGLPGFPQWWLDSLMEGFDGVSHHEIPGFFETPVTKAYVLGQEVRALVFGDGPVLRAQFTGPPLSV